MGARTELGVWVAGDVVRVLCDHSHGLTACETTEWVFCGW